MKAMVLAAGLGTRFRPHTLTAPKSTFPFLNIPLINYALYLAQKVRAQELVVNTHHLPEKIEACLKQGPWTKPLHLSHEREILGNGGGLGKVRDRLSDEPFFVFNSDTVVLPENDDIFDQLISSHLSDQALASLLVMPHPEVGKKYGGVWIDGQGRVHGFGRTRPSRSVDLKPYHFFGVRLFHPRIFSYIPEGPSDIFTDVLTEAIAKGETVKAQITQATFFDGGSLDGYLEDHETALQCYENSSFYQSMAKALWADQSRRKHWRCGPEYQGSERLWQEPSRLFGKNVKIDPSVEISGLCVLGDDVEISAGCRLHNVVVESGACLPAKTAHENELVLNLSR